MVTKLLLLQCRIFGCDFVELARNVFRRNSIAPQALALVLLVSLENPTFRDETVL
jgi:hypothetical protein